MDWLSLYSNEIEEKTGLNAYDYVVQPVGTPLGLTVGKFPEPLAMYIIAHCTQQEPVTKLKKIW